MGKVLSDKLSYTQTGLVIETCRVATVREKYVENEIFSRSGKSQGILWMAREIQKGLGKLGKSQGIWKINSYAGSLQKLVQEGKGCTFS